MLFRLIGAGANLGRDCIFAQRRRSKGMLQAFITRFAPELFERLMIFFVARPVRNLA
jgi:hypothetical protein